MLASKLGINIYVGFGVEGASPTLKRKPFSVEYTRQDERSFGMILRPLLLHDVCAALSKWGCSQLQCSNSASGVRGQDQCHIKGFFKALILLLLSKSCRRFCT